MEISILAIFGAGLLSFASPCVLPLMPVYLATIAGGSLADARPRRTLIVASAFVFGLSAVFVALGALASSFGAALSVHRTAISLASGALMLVFGLHGLGIWRLGRLERDVRPGLARVRSASTLAGAALFGAAFALGWSPCIGPVLAAVLAFTAAHAESPWIGAGYLAVYAAGLSLPLLLLALGAGHAVAWVRRARVAIPKLERLTGVAMLGVGLWTLAAALPDVFAEHDSAAQATAACAVEGPGHTCALPDVLPGASDALPLELDRGQLLEFSSHDCPICRRMRPIIEKLAASCDLETRIVRVDVMTPAGRALADRFHVRGTPTFVLLNENGIEAVRLLGENSDSALAAAIERAFGVSCWG